MVNRKMPSLILLIAFVAFGAAAQDVLSLEDCRRMALSNNKTMRIMAEKVRQAEYQNKEAFAAYLPAIDFNGGYMYNSRKLSIFDSDQFLPIKNFDLATQSYQFDAVKNPMTGEPVIGPNGEPVPSQVAYLPKDAMTYDIHNVFFGAITLTQPVYMGGKIVAMNKITKFAEEAARELRNNSAADVIYAVDGAYWQIVSLNAKEKLAENYVALLDTLHNNVQRMIDQGVATPSDLLTVDVKRNSANVDLVKVKNGLVLSRMALCQLIGLPIDQSVTLADENMSLTADELMPDGAQIPSKEYDMAEVYARRPDMRALELSVKVADQQSKVAMSDMLPTLALTAGYGFSNPNMFDGFKKRFSGAFNVGAVLHIPLWHWGGDYNKYRAAKADADIARLKLDDARELVELQVNQAAFKSREVLKTCQMTRSNIAKADDNLNHARLGYREGVMTTQNVLEAQTAWLKARSENIDAEIDVHLCRVYLSKVLGTLNY